MTPEQVQDEARRLPTPAEVHAWIDAQIASMPTEPILAKTQRKPNKGDIRKARRARGLKALAERDAKHPRLEGFGYPGPQSAWADLLDHWWTAAEWLARWRRIPERHRRGIPCPPRPWINPRFTTLRGGLRSRRLP